MCSCSSGGKEERSGCRRKFWSPGTQYSRAVHPEENLGFSSLSHSGGAIATRIWAAFLPVLDDCLKKKKHAYHCETSVCMTGLSFGCSLVKATSLKCLITS